MRKIEDVIFAAKKPDYTKCEKNGFSRQGSRYVYKEDFLEGDFRAVVSIDERGIVSGMVWDVALEEEYTPLRIEAYDGAFVNTVRTAYEEILSDIASKCFDDMPFATNQANRITNLIKETLGDDPDFPWNDAAGVFRNANNEKWYAIIMYVPLGKLTRDPEDDENFINVMNVKIDPEDGDKIRSINGIYEAFHMNHKSWVSIRLDDVVDDSTIMELLDASMGYTQGYRTKRNGQIKKWIVPANPKYYDIVGAFSGVDETIWKQGKGIEVDDIVYMYVGAPYSAILYKCTVIATHIATSSRGGKANVRELMKVRIDSRYSNKKCTLYKMKQFGVTTVRGPRFMPEDLEKFLEEE